MLKRNILYITGVLATVMACNPAPREMPITTTSEEARQLFIEARNEWEINRQRSPSFANILREAQILDSTFALAYLLYPFSNGVPKAKELINNVSYSESLYINVFSDPSNRYVYLDSLLKLHPRDKHCQLLAGLLYNYIDEQRALNHYNKASRIDKSYSAPYYWIGKQQIFLGNYDEAEDAIIKFCDYDPNNSQINQLYGNFYLHKDDPESARIHYEKMKLNGPPSIYNYLINAWLYIHEERFEEAINYIKSLYGSSEIRTFDPDSLTNYRIYDMEALVNYIINKPQVSLEIIDKRIGFSAEKGDYYQGKYAIWLKSWYLIHSGKPELAIDLLNSELNNQANLDSLKLMTRRNYLLHFNGTLCIAYLELGDNVKAKEYLQRAWEYYRSNEQNRGNDMGLMGVYESVYAIYNGDYETAITHLRNAGNGTSLTRQYYLALAYDLAGNTTKALGYYNMVRTNTNTDFAGLFYNKARQRIEALENDK